MEGLILQLEKQFAHDKSRYEWDNAQIDTNHIERIMNDLKRKSKEYACTTMSLDDTVGSLAGCYELYASDVKPTLPKRKTCRGKTLNAKNTGELQLACEYETVKRLMRLDKEGKESRSFKQGGRATKKQRKS